MFCSSSGEKEQLENAKYCSACGGELSQGPEDIYSLIKLYFHRGYIHVRTLKRKLQEMGLKRRGNEIDIDIVRETIRHEMQGAGELAGYRYIWHALRLRHHIHVPRSMVSKIMKEIDPAAVEERARRRLKRRNYISRGPNFCWHIDGECHKYRKIKCTYLFG